VTYVSFTRAAGAGREAGHGSQRAPGGLSRWGWRPYPRRAVLGRGHLVRRAARLCSDPDAAAALRLSKPFALGVAAAVLPRLRRSGAWHGDLSSGRAP